MIEVRTKYTFQGGFPQVVYFDPETGRLAVEDGGPAYMRGFFTHWARVPLPSP